MAEKLSKESVQGWMKRRSGWRRRSNALEKDFKFASFRDAIVFVNRVATLADDARHHPDIDIRFDRVTVKLSTHDVRGITEKDIRLAEQMDFATSAG